MQYENARDFVLPFIEKYFPIKPGMRVMEIGCAEAGVLKAFYERGCECLGIELHEERIVLGKQFLAEEMKSGRIELISKNIFHVDFEGYKGKFDLVILKDVIEHVPDQEKLIAHLGEFLNPSGKIFFGFPPWNMPFGGHQQIAKSKFLGNLPWFHLLPKGLYRQVLNWGGEEPPTIAELMEIWDCGISTARFERSVKNTGQIIVGRYLWLINPIYSLKFGLKPRKLPGFLSVLPFFRDFIATAGFYLTGKKQ